MSDLIPSPNSKSPTGLTSSGSKKTKSKLSGQYSPTSSLSSQSPTQKSKHTRNNSSKISSFSFQAQMADSAGDGMFELLSVPIDNKTLMQYVKTSLKKDGSVSSPKKSSQEVISSTQSIVIPKSEAEKMKAAVLLAQKLQVLLRKSFKAFATAVEANNRQIYKKPNNQAKVLIKNMKNLNLTSSEIARNLEALDKDSGSNLNTPNTQYFPEMKSIGYLPSFPVSTLNSSHLMNEEVKENNGVPRTYSTDLINKNKEAIAQNNSIYSVHDANAPGEKLPMQIDATSEIYPSNSNVEDANEVEGQESSSNNRIYTVPESQPVQETQHSGQKLKNMMTPAPKFLFDKSGTEQKKKESFRSNDSLMSNDYDNQYPAAKLSNSQFGQFKLNQSMDLIRYKSDTTDAQFPRGNFVSLGSAEKLSSVYRADSQTSVSNDIFFKSLSVLGSSPKLNYVREDDRFYDGLISGALPQKTRALYRLAYIFYKTSGMYDMFKIMKDTARMYLSSPKSSSMRSYETPKSQTILFPNYSYFPQSANLGFALNLDKILETDSRDMTSKGRDGTSQRVVMAHTPSYSYEILRMQHKMKALLILEKVCANLVRKVYRTSFADLNSIKDCSLYIDHENQTVQINEGNIATSRDLSQLISNTSRFNKDDKSSTERKSLKQEYYSELFDGRSKLKNIVDPKNKNQPKVEQKAVQHQEREIERGHVVETSFLTPRETIHTQVNTERVRLANQAPKVEIKDYNESALEERLERSLEKKLESKLNQNLDEKLRGKLQKELLKLLGKDLNIGSSRRQNSQDMGIQTDGPIQTSSLHYLDKPVYGKKLNVSIEDMYHNKTLPGHLNQVPSQDSKFPYYYANANSMPRYSGEERYYNKAYHKFFDSSSGIKEFSAIGRPEDNMMFSCESPIRDVTILDHSESKLDEIFNYSPRGNGASSRVIDEAKPTRLTPQRYGARTTTPNDYLHPNFDVNRSTSNLPLNRVEDKFRSHPHFVHGSSAMASQVQSIAFLERALMRKVNQSRYEAFEQLKKLVPQAQSGNGHRIMNFLEANYMKAQAQNLVRASPGHVRGHSFNQGYTNQGYMNQVQTNMTNYLYSSLQQPQTFGRAENPGHKQRLSETFENMNERFAVAPKQKYTMSKNETLVFVLQKLTLRRLKTAFNKFQRPIVTQNLRSYQKKSTLNYLLFAKKVEKVYISKLRTSFTRLCLKNSVNSNNKGLKLAKFFQNNQLKQKKTFFNKLRAISTRHLNVQNSLGKLFSLLNQKKLRSLSEAFFLTASYSLVKKEYMLNLTLITMQLSELKKAKLRSAFLALKQHTSRGNDRKRDKKQVLKNVLHETKLRWYFAMKHAFLRWKGTASNLSTTKLNESRIVDRDRAVKLHMATLLRNLFSSEMKMEKFQAFYKIKHHTRNSKGALALYNVLSKKVWNRQRFGLENIMKTKRDSDSSSEDEVQIRLENLAEIVKDRLHAGLMKIYMYSQGMRSPTARIDVKKGLLRLCVISEDIKQKFLLHGLKMLELYNIHKRNQKALYVNLGLKLWLLFEEKEKSLKKDFFSILSLNFEKEDYQQKVLEKLLRRTHTKNLAYFFNKYKSEIVNVKLNDSIVNLAIKNIILAVEKVSKVQRARMGLVLRKLALATLGKQLEVENSIVVAQQTSTLFKLREIGSVESIGMVSPKISQEDNKLRNTRLSQVIEKMIEIRLHHAFKKLRSNLRASKLIERLSDVDSEIFKKVIYKRIFFGFAQIKYIVEKRQQKMVAQKLFKLQSVIQKFDKSLPRSVEDGFRKWAATVKSDSQHLAKSLEVLAKQKKVKFFGKWKKAMKNREQRTEKFVAILAKIEKSSEKKLAKLVKLAFTRIMKSKQLEITLPSNRSMLELAPPTPSKKKKVTKAKSPQARTIDKKLNLNFDKRVTSGGSLIMTEKSPTNSVKKSTARSIEEGMVVSPASRFSKAANMAGAKDASPTSLTISSQPSSKMSTPIHAPKTKKKGKDKNF